MNDILNLAKNQSGPQGYIVFKYLSKPTKEMLWDPFKDYKNG